MTNTIYGYARVSTKEQCEDRQMIALKEYGIKDENIYLDKISGKDFKRPKYTKLLRKIKENDIIVVMSIDRLGRNYDEILTQWRMITKEKKAHMVVLDMPLLDTRQKEEGLITTFVADMVLQILSYVAETERINIKKRQKEGIEAAKRRGVRFGRPKKDKPNEFKHIKKAWSKRELSSRKAAAILGVSQDTFLRWAHENSTPL